MSWSFGESERHRIDYWSPDTTSVSPLTTESLPEPFPNPSSPILEDVVIHDSNDELMLVEADPSCRSSVIESIQGQSFYDRATFP